MSLNRDDISKVNYKAKIQWYKERAYGISDGTITLQDYLKEKSSDFEATTHTPDELISVLEGLSSKVRKLEDKISFLSVGLSIPVDSTKMPELSIAVSSVDSTSQGSYISYDLYDKLLKEQRSVQDKINLDNLSKVSTGDSQSDSFVVQDLMYGGYADHSGKFDSSRSLRDNSIEWSDHNRIVNQILDYADRYIYSNPDIRYIAWSMRRSVWSEGINCDNTADLWRHYSDAQAHSIGAFIDGSSVSGALETNSNIHDLTTRYITYTNNFLNRCNEMFDMEWAIDLICCFIQWGIRLDIKTLRGIRAILQLMQSGLSFDFNDTLNGVLDILKNIFKGAITVNLVGMVDQIIQRLLKPINKWISDAENDTWDRVFKCTPVLLLINTYISQAIIRLEELLYGLVKNWYKKIELQNIKNSLEIDLKTNQKWMGILADLLDTIIDVSEKAAQCGIAGSPNNQITPQFIENYNIGNTNKYQFPVDENPTIYNSFIPIDPDLSKSDSAAPVKTSNPDTGAEGSKATSSRNMSLSDCLKRMPIEDISGVKDWLIPSKSNF